MPLPDYGTTVGSRVVTLVVDMRAEAISWPLRTSIAERLRAPGPRRGKHADRRVRARGHVRRDHYGYASEGGPL